MSNANRYGVFATSAVRVGRDGSSAIATGEPETLCASFDEAYEAAQALGGDRWVIHTKAGSSEYVEAVS